MVDRRSKFFRALRLLVSKALLPKRLSLIYDILKGSPLARPQTTLSSFDELEIAKHAACGLELNLRFLVDRLLLVIVVIVRL